MPPAEVQVVFELLQKRIAKLVEAIPLGDTYEISEKERYQLARILFTAAELDPPNSTAFSDHVMTVLLRALLTRNATAQADADELYRKMFRLSKQLLSLKHD